MRAFYLCFFQSLAFGGLLPQTPFMTKRPSVSGTNISTDLFSDLEELSRIVDISYCIGLTGTGIQKPFSCASRCHEFENFELVETWNTGQLMSDSCGYIVLSHPPSPPRIILAFRGTYSVANTVIDLSTIPQEYIPYPDGDDDDREESNESRWLKKRGVDPEKAECTGCTVHMGFMISWQNTKRLIMSQVKGLIEQYPDYQLTLVGHSLGGAVAALASLDFYARGWSPQVTTFGEPRIGNQGLVQYIDKVFEKHKSTTPSMYRRVTHVDDPVPLLPLTEWGFQPHASEIYISRPGLPPEVQDLRDCKGDVDADCIAGGETATTTGTLPPFDQSGDIESFMDWWKETKGALTIPARWRIWQIFFAHRDYFWRLGLCVPDDWYGLNPHRGDE